MLVALALFSTAGMGRGGPNESLSGKLPLLRLLDEAVEVVFGLNDGVGGLLVMIPCDADARKADSSTTGETLSPYSRAIAFQNELR